MLPKPQDAAGWSHQPRSSSCSTPSLLAEAKDHANRSSVAGVVDDLPAGNVRDSFPTAADEVELQGKRAPALDPETRRRMICLAPTSGPTSLWRQRSAAQSKSSSVGSPLPTYRASAT